MAGGLAQSCVFRQGNHGSKSEHLRNDNEFTFMEVSGKTLPRQISLASFFHVHATLLQIVPLYLSKNLENQDLSFLNLHEVPFCRPVLFFGKQSGD